MKCSASLSISIFYSTEMVHILFQCVIDEKLDYLLNKLDLQAFIEAFKLYKDYRKNLLIFGQIRGYLRLTQKASNPYCPCVTSS